MLYFNCDYTEGCHPRILEKLAETNLTQTVGYGEDEYCQAARALIRKECGREDVDVHFLVGGTQANFTVIRAALRPHQGAIAPVTGHINGHETGAVEEMCIRDRGYSDPEWVQAVAGQAGAIQHLCNYYYSPENTALAQELSQASGMAKAFFCNSGAEANECAVKVARKYGEKRGAYRIVTLQNSFHGRTLTTRCV